MKYYFISAMLLIPFLMTYYFANAELYTSVYSLEVLAVTQKELTNKLKLYIQSEKKRIRILKNYLAYFKKEHGNSSTNKEQYFRNPLNSYTIIKRLTLDLEYLEKNIQHRTSFKRDKQLVYPSKEDISEAAVAIKRLTSVYLLNITDLSKGILKGNFGHTLSEFQETVSPMISSDCYTLGKELLTAGYKEGIFWMIEALNRFVEDDRFDWFTEDFIREEISNAYFSFDDIRNSLKWIEKSYALLQAEDPRRKELKMIIESYNEQIEKGVVPDNIIDINVKIEGYDKVARNKFYKPLCRGEMILPHHVTKRLYCRYANDQPFLTIAPLKKEQLYYKPDIYLVHDAVNDKEIDGIIDFAKSHLKPANTFDAGTGYSKLDVDRVGKSAWIKDNDTTIARRLSQRISDFTGLSTESAEYLSVLNYGIGGFYVPHHDFVQKDVPVRIFGTDNRLATVMFYLSDVEQGGATIFAELGLTVYPLKGAALFWNNLHPSGDGDFAVYHAGCPVLRGSKWIAIKWLHMIGQEFLRPCTLKYQSEGFQKKILPATFKKTEKI